ncbi:MAG: phage terminase small subunit P27 family [Betaproteobacteria bacterium]
MLRLRGNTSYLTKREAASGAIEPEIEIPGCPRHLLPEAKKEWKRIGVELETLGLVSRIDRTALSLYCQEYAWWVWQDEALQRDIQLAEAKHAVFLAEPANKDLPWLGGDGFTLATPNGGWAYNPHWVARNKHALQCDRFLANFGMSPSARGRVTASHRQLELPLGDDKPVGGFHAL